MVLEVGENWSLSRPGRTMFEHSRCYMYLLPSIMVNSLEAFPCHQTSKTQEADSLRDAALQHLQTFMALAKDAARCKELLGRD